VDTLPTREVALAALAAGIKIDVSIIADKIKPINFFIATSFLVTLKARQKSIETQKACRLRGYFGDFLLYYHTPFAYMHIHYIMKMPRCEYSKFRKISGAKAFLRRFFNKTIALR
jgi:hypothetical protein